jgi:hypothetical protein
MQNVDIFDKDAGGNAGILIGSSIKVMLVGPAGARLAA